MEFEEYFTRSVTDTGKFNYSYLGISRKEYPKWQGWKIIKEYGEKGVHVSRIDDGALALHVRNFYFLKYIQETVIGL